MLAAYALASIVSHCAPSIGRVTMSAIVAYESGAQPYAIGDNTARRSYFPRRRSDAIALANDLASEGHDLDIGYAQVNVANLRAAGLDFAAGFEPCTNVRLAARILRDDYARSAARYGPGQVALVHALSAYNTGEFFAGLGYAHGVYAIAARLRPVTLP